MSRPLRSVFRDIVLFVSCVPLAACSAVVVPDYGDGGDTQPDAPVVNACGPRVMGESCSAFESWPCGLPIAVMQPGSLSGAMCDAVCPDFVSDRNYFHSCSVSAADPSTGATRAYCLFCGGGRRPDGWSTSEPIANDALGAFFAAMAELEAASVPAFRMLAGDLERFGAPASLVTAARVAMDDEILHTRVTRDLARRFGGTPRSPFVRPVRATSIESIATLNATEGLVGEAFGALLATYQSLHAGDDAVRAVMARIAEDESRHAELAFEVARWADALLDETARDRVRIARDRSLAALRDGFDTPIDPVLAHVAGMPDASVRERLFEQFAEHVRAAA